MSAVISGVLYAFRALQIPRQKLALEALSGRLRSTDMDALANCSAIATAALVNMEMPQLDLGDWVAAVETTGINGVLNRERPPELSLAEL